MEKWWRKSFITITDQYDQNTEKMLWMYRDFSRTQPLALIWKKETSEWITNEHNLNTYYWKKVFAFKLFHLRNLSNKGVRRRSYDILSLHRCIIRVICSKIVCNVFAIKKIESGLNFFLPQSKQILQISTIIKKKCLHPKNRYFT